MAKKVRTILSILIFIAVTALAAGAGYWSYALKHWPLWIAACMALGVYALYFLILFLKKYFVRRHERKFVQRIVDHGETLEENTRPEQIAILELEKSWKSNLSLLKSSHLNKKGNPLFVLPWYLAMGPPGVGKSTMLANSGVATSFTEIEDREGRIEPTKNCDWVFFNNAVIFDTAGRYSIPLSSNNEQNEWKRFLFLLSSSRRREPLNGIVLFVGADDLIKSKSHELAKKAQILRNRIHSLMRITGFKVPVSVMVTRMDTVPGFTQLAECLPEEARAQVMGQLNNQATPYWKELLDLTITNLDEGLQNIRRTLVNQENGRKAALFSLPLELNPLKKGLESFLNALFSENSYQETPALQGIYFGSGLCSASPLPSFLDAGPETTKRARRTFSSVFAHDFFAQVLPSGRWNLEPVKEFRIWKRMVNNLATVLLLTVAAFICGVIGLSYFHNQKVFSLLPTETQAISKETPGSNGVLVSLEKMRLSILEVEKENSAWRLPFSLFNNSLEAEKNYKKAYCQLFSSTLLNPIEKGFEKAANRMNGETPLKLYADYCAYSVEQSIYLQRYLAGQKTTPFNSFNQVASAILSMSNHNLLSEVGSYFPKLNDSYLAWSNDTTGAEERLERLQKTLQLLLTKNSGDISWLYTIPIADTPAITLASFWKQNQQDTSNAVLVPGAFTAKGRSKINAFLSAIEQAGTAESVTSELRKNYLGSYQHQFLHWWKRFGDDFQDGELVLTTHSDWREAAIRMAAADNPYFSMMDTMASELSAYVRDTGNVLPGWGKSIIAINDIRKLARSTKTTKNSKPSLTSKILNEKDKIAAETLQDIDPTKAATMNEQLKLAAAWRKYEDGISGLDVITPYKEKAATEYTSWFQIAAGSGANPSVFTAPYDAWVTLKTMGQKEYSDPFIWKIAAGPFIFLQDFAARETALVLQEKWQEDVVSVTSNMDEDKISAVLFKKPGGLVWNYLKKYANPFVMLSTEGYTARNFYGRSLIFEPDFYSLLNTGSSLILDGKSKYTVKITTKPMEVNSEADIDPTYSVLAMQCAGKKYLLENDNFPRELTVDWSQGKCGEVSLTIEFPEQKLVKKWTGNLGFVSFLKQFQNGNTLFTTADFPDQAGFFKNHTIDYIGISFELSGLNDILKLLNTAPKKLSHRIILPKSQETAKSLPTLSGKILSEFVESTNVPLEGSSDVRVITPARKSPTPVIQPAHIKIIQKQTKNKSSVAPQKSSPK